MPRPPRSPRTGLLLLVLFPAGLLALATCGGPILLAATLTADSVGAPYDGIGLILPGLVIATVYGSVVLASGVVMIRAARRAGPVARARLSAGLAIAPVVITGAFTVGAARARYVVGAPGLEGAWLGSPRTACLLLALAAVALAVAAAPADRSRVPALGAAAAALVAVAVIQPDLVAASLQGGALVICAALLLRGSRGDAAQFSGRVPSGSAPPA